MARWCLIVTMSGSSNRRISCYYRRRFASCMLLLSNSDRGTDIVYMLQHEDRVFLGIFELLEKEERLFVVTETSLYPVTSLLVKTIGLQTRAGTTYLPHRSR